MRSDLPAHGQMALEMERIHSRIKLLEPNGLVLNSNHLKTLLPALLPNLPLELNGMFEQIVAVHLEQRTEWLEKFTHLAMQIYSRQFLAQSIFLEAYRTQDHEIAFPLIKKIQFFVDLQNRNDIDFFNSLFIDCSEEFDEFPN